MFLLISKGAVIGIVVAAAIIQWVLATISLYLLLKDNGVKKNILRWNIIIMFGIIVGPVTYLIKRHIARKDV